MLLINRAKLVRKPTPLFPFWGHIFHLAGVGALTDQCCLCSVFTVRFVTLVLVFAEVLSIVVFVLVPAMHLLTMPCSLVPLLHLLRLLLLLMSLLKLPQMVLVAFLFLYIQNVVLMVTFRVLKMLTVHIDFVVLMMSIDHSVLAVPAGVG